MEENVVKTTTIKSLRERKLLCRNRIKDFEIEIQNIDEMLALLEPDKKKEERDLAALRG